MEQLAHVRMTFLTEIGGAQKRRDESFDALDDNPTDVRA
jgi:hypothetical protein